MKRRTGSFTAQGDDHKIYTIYEFTDFEDIRTHDDYATVKIPGSRELRTSDGTPVNLQREGCLSDCKYWHDSQERRP